jgi:hypothetical protein
LLRYNNTEKIYWIWKIEGEAVRVKFYIVHRLAEVKEGGKGGVGTHLLIINVSIRIRGGGGEGALCDGEP